MGWQCLVCGYIEDGPAPPAECPSCGAPFTAFERLDKEPKERFKGIEIVEERPAGYRYVIIGNSAAGRSAARAIQALDPDGKITVISEEPDPLYVRPLLPDFIGGMSSLDFFGAASHFSETGLNIRLGDGAVRLDVKARQVVLASGETVSFDALLLATGSAPIQIPWPGSEAEGIAYFRTFADAERIARLARSATHAVVVGGGLLGLEFVRAFQSAQLRITQLVRERQVGWPALDEKAGPIIQQALGDLGVNLALEEEVQRFEARDGRVCGVHTSKGRLIECDLVGIAVGARPRVELAQEAGLEVDRGILVDRRFQTSAPDVYAAGDVAQAFDRVWGERRVNTSWRNAQQQGEWAGIAMAGGAVEYPGGMAANYQLAAGLPFCAIGIANPPNPEDFDIQIEADEAARTYRKIVRRKGVIVGAVLIGDLSEAADLEQQIGQA